jgi:DNA invertase Pin-like site-specific DNA recombinase
MESMSPRLRVALYLRFSAEMQRMASIADQERECRAFAARNGWQVRIPRVVDRRIRR